MKPVEVTEGTTVIEVPEYPTGRGPKARSDEVFYNPATALSRDLGVLVVRAWFGERCGDRRALDALAGSGIRGLRLAREAGLNAVINDFHPLAHDLIVRNIARYPELHDRVRATSERAQRLMHTEMFDYIDIDPYGTPVAYLDSAVQAVRDGGLLGISATDTAVLCGAMPAPALRRYGGRTFRCPPMHELATRLLLGWAVREAAKHEVAATPVFVHATDHYIRIYLAIRHGSKRAGDLLEQMRFFVWDKETQHGLLTTEPPADLVRAKAGGPGKGWAGPLWGGPMWNPDLLARIGTGIPLARPTEVARLLELIREEAGMPAIFHQYHERCKRLGLSPATTPVLLERLRREGFTASRTHFTPIGFRTSALPSDVDRIITAISPSLPHTGGPTPATQSL